MKFLQTLKQSFSSPALKKSAMAMGGGAGVGLAHLYLSKNVAWLTSGDNAWAKRSGAAALLALTGGALVKGTSTEASSGMQGAMGAVIAYELVNHFGSATAKSYKFQGFLSNLARTQARQLNGTNVRDLSGARSHRAAAAARFMQG